MNYLDHLVNILIGVYLSIAFLPDTIHSSLDCGYEAERRIILNEQADIFLSVLLNVYGTDVKNHSCGNVRKEGVVQFESLRWMLQRLNKNFGQIGTRIIQDTFIPGIQLGLRVYDTCGDRNRMLAILQEEYPELGNHSSTACKIESNSSRPSFGVLDFTGKISEDDQLTSLLEQHGVPSLSMNADSLTESEERAKAIVSFLSHFGWKKVSLVTTDEEPKDLRLAEEMTFQSKAFNVCITDFVKLPVVGDGSWNPSQDFKSTIAYKINSRLLMQDAIILVISETERIKQVLEALKLKQGSRKEHFPHIILSAQPTQFLDTDLLAKSGEEIWMNSLYPSTITELNDSWKAYQNINSFKRNHENRWIIHYFEVQNNCLFSSVSNSNGKLCSTLNFNESSVDRLWASVETYTILHGMAVMATALKQAWRVKCRNRRGSCETLLKMRKADFREDFLNSMELSHSGPGSRSPSELIGYKVKGDAHGSLHGMAFGFYNLFLDTNGSVKVNEVLKLTPLKVETISNETFTKFKIDKDREIESCQTDISFKDSWQVQETRNKFSVLAKLVNKQEKHIFLPSSDDMIIAGLFPLHYHSEDGTDCNKTINEEAMQEAEAFLWAIDQINKHQKLLPQSTLGALVLDTCGSKIRAVNQVTNLVKNVVHGLEVNSSHILCVVASFEPSTARVIGDILASLNITLINLGAADTHNPFVLQMKPTIQHEAEAIIQILRHIGWDFISLAVSVDDFESNLGGDAFKNIAKASRVCIATEIRMKTMGNSSVSKNSKMIIQKLKQGVARGTKGIVTFLTPVHLQLLLGSFEEAIYGKAISMGYLTFFGSANWGDQQNQFYRFNETLRSVLLLQDGQLEVIPFSLHYRLLSPLNNRRNPWFEEYWNQHFLCNTSVCSDGASNTSSSSSVIPYSLTPSTPRVIQGVFSFGAALTQLLQHICPHAKGKLCPGLPMWRQRVILNEFLRNTEVSRVDKPSEYFQFSDNFHGNTPLEIVNLEKLKEKNLEYKKIGRYVNSNLSIMAANGNFANGTSFSLNAISSTCEKDCQLCDDQNLDFVFVESRQKIYILAFFEVHETGQNLLECGPIRSDQGIQNVESLLWVLRKVNDNSPFELGAIIFDTCNNKEKVGRDLTDFLTGRIPEKLKIKVPSLNQIVGIVTGSRGEVLTRILDITKQYHLPTIATQASQSFPSEKHYPALITLAPSNAAYARSLISLITYWRWRYVSLVYSDFGDSKDTSKFLLQELQNTDVKLSTFKPIPEEFSNIEYMLDIWSSLAEGAKGSRVVILLLETSHEILFFQTASKLFEDGLTKLGDFIFITSKSVRPFVKTDAEALGSLTIQPLNGYFDEFATYFTTLSITNKSHPYPWFQEFWSKIHNCRGAACYNTNETKLTKYPFRQAKGIVETVNAVTVIKECLNITLKQACKGNWPCASFKPNSVLENNLLGTILNASIRGVDGNPVLINSEGYNSAATLQILNYQVLNNQHSGLVRVGSFNDLTGLSLNGSRTFTYNAKGDPILYKDVQTHEYGEESFISQINTTKWINEVNMENVDLKNAKVVSGLGNGFTQMYSDQRFGISIQLPVHRKSDDFFSCGEFFSDSVFQNLVAVAYALSEMNKKNPNVGIGAIAFDFCDRTEKAREQLFRYFSGDLQNTFQRISMTKERIVAAIDFSDKAAEAVWTILSSNHIPQFSSPVGGWEVNDKTIPSIMSSVPSRSAEIRIYISLLKLFKWNYISVVYDNDETGQAMVRMLRKLSRRENICIGDSLSVPKRLSQEYSQELVETLSIYWKPRVVILLMDDSDNIRTLLEVFHSRNQSENFIFLSGYAWGNKMGVVEDLYRISTGALTITLETYDLPEFRQFISNLNLKNHDPINTRWFEEYFQHKFKCKLISSQYPLSVFKKECSGTETIHADDIIQDPFVFHTVLIVNTIVHGLDSYLRKNCASAKTMEECEVIQEELLLHIKDYSRIFLNNTHDLNLYDREGAFGYHIWNYRRIGHEYGYINIGNWQNGKLKVESSNVEFKIGPYAPESFCNAGPCLDTCAFQSPIYVVKRISDPLPVDHNFKSIYGIVTSSLSLLGIVLILITLVYFMVLYPTIEGTSVLGYFIITGCLMIYAVNFAFIFQPTIGTCALRRFLMGLAYAIVHSSLLVKVLQSWRLANYDEDVYANKPAILILVSVALIMVQVILGISWLILYPPQIDLIENYYRCSPGETFEKDLVVSLIYVMMLIAITLIFCAETWHSREIVKDTRWVLLASSFNAFTWFIWALVATQAPISFRDPATVIGNLVSATSVLLFLYARRSYIYSYLKEEMKDFELNNQIATASYFKNSSSQLKLNEPDILRPPTINPIRESMPGTQYVGGQEVSFRTVTLPPDEPDSRISTKMTRHYRTSRSSIRSVSLPRNLHTGYANKAFESSEEECDANIITSPSEDEENMSSQNSTTDYEYITDDGLASLSNSSRATAILALRQPPIKRVGSRQMLVFLTDGNTFGEVSRI